MNYRKVVRLPLLAVYPLPCPIMSSDSVPVPCLGLKIEVNSIPLPFGNRDAIRPHREDDGSNGRRDEGSPDGSKCSMGWGK